MASLEGKRLPAFPLKDGAGKPIKIADLKAPYVLYVYPEDDTPTCTLQACSFRDGHAALRKAGLTVYGLSPDDAAKHAKFRAKFSLPFELLTADQRGLETLGVWRQKQMFGNTYMGVSRETFLVGRDGKVAKHYGRIVGAEHHAERVLADWKALQ